MNRFVVYRNCFTGDVSGGDMHMSGLLSWLLDTKREVDPLLVRPHRDGQEKVYPEVARLRNIMHPDTKLKQSIALMYVARAFSAARRINKFADRADMLVASSHFLPDVLPVFMARAPKAAKTVFIHHIIADMERPDTLNTRLANVQEKLCFSLIKRGFGKIIVVNQQVADRLRELGFKKQQILLSSNFVNPLAAQRSLAQKDITLAFCGRMVGQKGVDDFVHVCKKLAPLVPNFRAVMIGVGPELVRLKAEIAREKLPIELAGYVDDQTKFDLISRAQLFVFPSAEEGWGIAVAEALSVGTPVVAYELPVYESVFGGHIYATPLKNQTLLAETTQRLLASYHANPATYQAEQARIAEYAEQFKIDRVAAREYDFIRSTT